MQNINNINENTIINIFQHQNGTDTINLYENSRVKLNNDVKENTINNFNGNGDFDHLQLFDEIQNQGIECNVISENNNTILQSTNILLDRNLSSDTTNLTQTSMNDNTINESLRMIKVENYLDKPIINLMNETLENNESHNVLFETIPNDLSSVLNLTNETNSTIPCQLEQLNFENNTTYDDQLPMLDITDTNQNDNNESRALELALATEEERQSPWIDINSLTNEITEKIIATPAIPIVQTESNWSGSALPTAVQSLVNLLGPEPYPLEIERNHEKTPIPETVSLVDTENLTNDNAEIITNYTKYQSNTDSIQRDINESNISRNVLQDITSDAGICKCSDCKCKSKTENCTNHLGNDVQRNNKLKKHDQINDDDDNNKQLNITDIITTLKNKCRCNNQNSCGSCCVVICIKSFQELQEELNNCCKTSNNTGCCKINFIGNHQGMSVPVSSFKSQLAGNQ